MPEGCPLATPTILTDFNSATTPGDKAGGLSATGVMAAAMEASAEDADGGVKGVSVGDAAAGTSPSAPEVTATLESGVSASVVEDVARIT